MERLLHGMARISREPATDLLLAVGLVFFTAFAVGWLAKLLLPDMPWAAAFTLGAIISPTDTAVSTAVVGRLRIPRRIVTVLEGESLVNDASGLVLYQVALVAAMTGQFSVAACGIELRAAVCRRHRGGRRLGLWLDLAVPSPA